jgi:ATP-dependent Lon protease
MKAIQKELGDDDQSKEIGELREKLNKLELPKEARQEVEREIGRLERAGRESMEAQVIRTYLEWIAELPWNNRSDDNLDLGHAQTVSTRITTACRM